LIIVAASSVLPARQGLSRSNYATPSSMKRCCQRLGLTCPAHDLNNRRTEQYDLAADDLFPRLVCAANPSRPRPAS
jgi:hypothetical protein